MDNNLRNEITYTNKTTKKQIKSMAKILGFYLVEIILWFVVIKIYSTFGQKWVVPSVSAMWIMGAFTSYKLKEDTENIIKETKWVILGYLCFLFLYRVVIKVISPISSEAMSDSLGISTPAVSGMAVSGFLQNILLITSVMTPIGFLIFLAQKFRVFKGRMSKQEAFDTVKDIRENKRRF